MTIGRKVAFPAPPTLKALVIFGGPGSGKGAIVANLCSMFGMQLVSAEALIFKYLPKKVSHTMELNTTKDALDLIRKEPEKVTLDWVLRLIEHHVQQDPDKIYIVDLLPNLKLMQRSEHLIANCEEHLRAFEEKVPLSLALNLSLTQDSLDQTLDYSHHNTASMTPAGATVGDEADNSRAKRRFIMHQNVCAPLLNYFSPDRTVSLDVSSGQHDAIWDKVCEVFTNLGLHAWRPVDSVLVFALEGMCVGSLDLADTEMQVIALKEVVHDPQASLETLLEDLSHHIDTLADKGHHFVIDTTDTAFVQYARSEEQFPKSSIVFSARPHDQTACVNKFSVRLNSLCGGGGQFFKAVCSSEDETLLFPESIKDDFCEHVAIIMAEKHPSKR